MYLTPRELDKLLIYSMADVALKRKVKGLKLNHPEAVAVISAAAVDGARAGKSLEEAMSESLTVDIQMPHSTSSGFWTHSAYWKQPHLVGAIRSTLVEATD